jgi:phospholipid N-methyltransferase
MEDESLSFLPQPMNWWQERWLFFTKFVRQGTAIAAFAPSSRWLARAATDGIDFTQAQAVIELGAGTGPVTAELVRRGTGRCRVVVIERDSDFCRRLRQRFPATEVVEADVNDLENLLRERHIGKVDHFISGLPLPSFAKIERDRLLHAIGRRLAPGGTFRQITGMPWVYGPLYRKYFDEVSFRLVLRNLPPGGTYLCRGLRGTGTAGEVWVEAEAEGVDQR